MPGRTVHTKRPQCNHSDHHSRKNKRKMHRKLPFNPKTCGVPRMCAWNFKGTLKGFFFKLFGKHQLFNSTFSFKAFLPQKLCLKLKKCKCPPGWLVGILRFRKGHHYWTVSNGSNSSPHSRYS